MAKRLLCLLGVGLFIALPPVWDTFVSITDILRSLDVNQVILYIRSFHVLAPIVSFFLMTFCVLAPFPSFLITFANSAVFGWVYGATLSWSGAMLGALVCFLISRYMGRAAVEKFTSRAALRAVDTFFEEHGKNTVLIARLLPFFSFSLVSYAAGLTSIRLTPYLIATGIGQLPATLIYSYVGEMLSGGIKYIVIGLLCLIAFSALLYAIKNYFTSKKKKASLANKNSLSVQGKKIAIVRNFQKKTSSEILSKTIIASVGEYKSTVFIPGCSLAFHSPLVIEKTYEHLSRFFPGIGLILRCCANPVLSVKDTESFTEFYQLLQDDLEKNNITSVITACPNCYVTIKKYSPHIKVESVYPLLCKTELPKHDYSSWPKAALHDPCPIKSEHEIHNSVRHLLDHLQYPYEEFRSHRHNTVCCGNKGMLGITDKKRASLIMKKRCEQTTCTHIISYCQSCVSSFCQGEKDSFHILELLFLDQSKVNVSCSTNSFLQRWYNRLYTKKRITLKKNRKNKDLL